MSGPYAYTPYLLPTLITAIITAGVSLYALHWRSRPGAVALALTGLFVFLWAVGSLLEMVAVDAPTRIFWSTFQAIWKQAVVVAELCFVLEYADPGRWLNRRTITLLSLFVLLASLLGLTNDAHHLVWAGWSADAFPQPVGGPLFDVFAGFMLLVVGVQVIVLLALAARSPQHRWPVALILLGQVAARVAFIVDRSNATAAPLDLALVFNALLFVFYALALSCFHLFDLIPVACATGIEQMETGLMVLDAQRRIVDVNPAAAKILCISASQVRGQSIGALPVHADLQARLDDASASPSDQLPPSDIIIGAGGQARYYSLHLTRLVDRRGVLLGHNVLLYDVTEQKRAQAQIVEQQRALATMAERERLARELHDSVGQMLGYVSLQAQAILKHVHDGHIATAEDQLTRLAEAARDAHADVRESILSLKAGSGREGCFLADLRQYLGSFTDHYRIATQLTIPTGLGENAFGPDAGTQLLRVIQEALTNARKHARARCVQVTFERQDSQAQITIADDGCGFDPDQLVTSGGDHLGLAFMRERMAQINGKVKIDSQPGAGTRVMLLVPIHRELEKGAS